MYKIAYKERFDVYWWYGFIHSGCKLTLHFSHLKMFLLPRCWHRQHFDSPFTTTWFKVSSFILVPAIPEVLRDCAGRFLPYFPRISSTSSRKSFNNGILFRWILQNILQEVTTVALSKRKKAITTFWNGFAHDKLTRTGQINQHFPYLHYTDWKDLVYVFSQLSTSALLTKLDLVKNRWQR